MERIVIENLSKEFKIGFKKKQSFLRKVMYFVSGGREPKKITKVLNEVSFHINAGEVVGIIGNNGSGKSTLLRIIAKIYPIYEGKVTTNGKIISLINLNVGLKDRLTMKDNIFLVGSLFGMSQKEIKEKFDSIVDFSGLKEFINTKLYQFSVGMSQRLSFSIAICANPEILLLDEVFEVGDEAFKKKSSNKIAQMAQGGCTVILVSHNFEIIEKYCNRVIWLDQGLIKKEKSPQEVVENYVTKNTS